MEKNGYAKQGTTIKGASEREMRETYVKAFGREFDDKRRKQFPLPIEIAYKTALQKLERENKLAKGSTIKGGSDYSIGGL